ncbi:hypothetical protein L914_19257, partial [Phytophthora nicotianae]
MERNTPSGSLLVFKRAVPTSYSEHLAEKIDAAVLRAAMAGRLDAVKWLTERCAF